MKEWPKWMHRKRGEDGVESKVFETEADVPQDEGWQDTPPDGPADTDDGTGVSLAQRQAADDLRKAEEAKRSADIHSPPSNAAPASEIKPLTNTDGHNGIEYRDAGGRVLMVADVDTMARDKLQNTLQALGVSYDGRSSEKSLRAALVKALSDPQENLAQSAGTTNTDTRAS